MFNILETIIEVTDNDDNPLFTAQITKKEIESIMDFEDKYILEIKDIKFMTKAEKTIECASLAESEKELQKIYTRAINLIALKGWCYTHPDNNYLYTDNPKIISK